MSISLPSRMKLRITPQRRGRRFVRFPHDVSAAGHRLSRLEIDPEAVFMACPDFVHDDPDLVIFAGGRGKIEALEIRDSRRLERHVLHEAGMMAVDVAGMDPKAAQPLDVVRHVMVSSLAQRTMPKKDSSRR
jgi:hypothetical protein